VMNPVYVPAAVALVRSTPLRTICRIPVCPFVDIVKPDQPARRNTVTGETMTQWGRKAAVACRAPVEVRPFH